MFSFPHVDSPELGFWYIIWKVNIRYRVEFEKQPMHTMPPRVGILCKSFFYYLQLWLALWCLNYVSLLGLPSYWSLLEKVQFRCFLVCRWRCRELVLPVAIEQHGEEVCLKGLGVIGGNHVCLWDSKEQSGEEGMRFQSLCMVSMPQFLQGNLNTIGTKKPYSSHNNIRNLWIINLWIFDNLKYQLHLKTSL